VGRGGVAIAVGQQRSAVARFLVAMERRVIDAAIATAIDHAIATAVRVVGIVVAVVAFLAGVDDPVAAGFIEARRRAMRRFARRVALLARVDDPIAVALELTVLRARVAS